METQYSQADKVSRNRTLKPMTWKTEMLHIGIGLVIGAIAYIPISLTSAFISDGLVNYGICDPAISPMEAFGFTILCCFIPSMIVSVVGGIAGGAISYNKGHKYLGAFLGGLLGQIMNVSMLTWSLC